jgi:hypothetical protein
MIHRLALRVVPRLALAVTADLVRKRKRWVMLASGLVAFLIYRLLKLVDPLSDPLILLAVSGLLSAITAGCVYGLGRGESPTAIWNEDGVRRLSWVVGWIGFVYGVQLSLMVLALLKVFVNYDFLVHPDGPAMIAIIIACTSVTRDAFEIGHVRRIQRQGEPILTFPDGAPLRALFLERPWVLAKWSLLGASGCAVLGVGVAHLAGAGRTELGQLVVVCLFAGSLAVWAYLAGEQRLDGWKLRLGSVSWAELFRFWWWPGLTFAATYYLTLLGAAWFALSMDARLPAFQALAAAAVGGLMVLYGYYLGHRRYVENRIQENVPPSLLRCPFVMGILSKSRMASGGGAVQPANAASGETGPRN